MNALLLCLDLYRDMIHGCITNFNQLVFGTWQLHFTTQNGTHFISCTTHAETVGTVRCQVQFKHMIVETKNLADWRANLRLFRQNENTFLLIFRQQFIVHAQLFGGTDHAKGYNTAQFGFLISSSPGSFAPTRATTTFWPASTFFAPHTI